MEIFLGVFIGAVTFTGSIIAFGKLSGHIGGKALILSGRHIFNILMVLGSFVLMIGYMDRRSATSRTPASITSPRIPRALHDVARRSPKYPSVHGEVGVTTRMSPGCATSSAT